MRIRAEDIVSALLFSAPTGVIAGLGSRVVVDGEWPFRVASVVGALVYILSMIWISRAVDHAGSRRIEE